MHVTVRDNNVDQALKVLKKKMQREGVFREMKLRRSYENPQKRKLEKRLKRYEELENLRESDLKEKGFSSNAGKF